MRLGEAQETFFLLMCEHGIWLYEHGYKVRGGDLFRDKRVHGEFGEKVAYGKANSNHKLKLAIDMNLMKDGVYIVDTEGHRESGEQWETLHPHCRWGGRFKDGNHYEFTQQPWRTT